MKPSKWIIDKAHKYDKEFNDPTFLDWSECLKVAQASFLDKCYEKGEIGKWLDRPTKVDVRTFDKDIFFDEKQSEWIVKQLDKCNIENTELYKQVVSLKRQLAAAQKEAKEWEEVSKVLGSKVNNAEFSRKLAIKIQGVIHDHAGEARQAQTVLEKLKKKVEKIELREKKAFDKAKFGSIEVDKHRQGLEVIREVAALISVLERKEAKK